MDTPFQDETERLRRSWDKYSREHLDAYLVAGVEDPRINAQSILTRALIADVLFPNVFDGIFDAEWRFGACMTWIVRALERGRSRWEMLDAIEEKNAATIPEFVLATHEALEHPGCPLPDYLGNALFDVAPNERGAVSNAALDVFVPIWGRALAARDGARLSIMEPACGSANDYRCMAHYGLARFLDYAGFDVSGKNVANARVRFPDVNFAVASVFEIPAEDDACEYLCVHDLFEHLSPEGLERAIAEVLRVARNEAWLSFFNLDSIPEHEFHPVADYYVNMLSLERIEESILRGARRIEVVDIPDLVARKTGWTDYYNSQAKTLIVEI